jgi:hypothetical protein
MKINSSLSQIEDDDKDSEEDKMEMEEAEKSLNAKSIHELNSITKMYKDLNQSTNISKKDTPGANPGHDPPPLNLSKGKKGKKENMLPAG